MTPNRVGDGDGWYGDLHPEIKPNKDPLDSPFTREQIADEFSAIDSSHNGKISFKEWVDDFRKFETVDKAKLEDIKLMFKAFDPDADGQISEREYLTALNNGALMNHNTTAL